MTIMRKEQKRWIAAGTAFIIIGILLIYRAFYGMDTTDETFYLAMAKRFYEGDLLFQNDWNTGQIFGLVMMPFYYFYLMVTGSNEGIILCARILFVFIALFVAGFTYKVLYQYTKKFGASLLASLCILVYVRGNIITCSYYSLGFYTFLLAILWWMDAKKEKKEIWKLICSGISFAVSVLCMPYMAVVFPLILLAGVYMKCTKKNTCFVRIVSFAGGVLLSAAVFLLCFSPMVPWTKLPQLLSIVFQDPGMESESFLKQLINLLIYMVVVFMKYTWPIYMATFLTVCITRLGKIKNKTVIKIMPWVLLGEFLIQAIYVRGYFEGGIIAATFFFILQLQIFFPDKRERLLEKYFIIPGLIYGAVWIAGSNVDQRVINMSFLIMNLWAVPFAWGIWEDKKFGKVCTKIPVCLMFCVLCGVRLLDIYRDGALTQLNTQVEHGVMKGLYTEKNRAEAYENAVEMLRRYTEPSDTIVTIGCDPWVYLDTQASCGAYTTWQVSDGDDLLRKYYNVNPDKIPNVIVKISDLVNTYEFWRFSSHGVGLYEGENLEVYGVLKEIIEEHEYKKIEEEGTVIYCAVD